MSIAGTPVIVVDCVLYHTTHPRAHPVYKGIAYFVARYTAVRFCGFIDTWPSVAAAAAPVWPGKL